jgi:hypothetical protein
MTSGDRFVIVLIVAAFVLLTIAATYAQRRDADERASHLRLLEELKRHG